MNKTIKKLMVVVGSIFVIVLGSYGLLAVLGLISFETLSSSVIIMLKVSLVVVAVVVAITALMSLNKE